MKTPRPLLLSALLATAAVLAQDQPPPNQPPPGGFGQGPGGPGFGGPGGPGFGGPGGPGGGRGFGGPMQQEVKVLARFDKNGDKHLDATERQAAREYLKANPTPGPGGRGGRGGFPGGGRGGFPGGGGGEPGSPGEKLTPADVKTYGNEPLYAPPTLRTLFFTFESADWEQELEDFHNTDVDVPTTLIVDGKTYRDVGIHFRGLSSYMMVRAGSKRSLNVTLDDVHSDQNLLGFRTLNLLNSHEDASFIRPVLFSAVAQNYLATPRVNLVRVVINGENWGVYANAEQFNKDFTKDRFNTTKGARWKVPGNPGGRGGLGYLGDNSTAYKGIYEIKTKDDEKSWVKLIRLCQVLNETPADQLEAALAPIFDIDGALKFLALDVAFSNGDGYWTRTSDYSIAEDDKGRLHVFPHDMNETFSFGGGPGGRGGRGGPGGPGGPGGFGPPPGGGPGFGPPPGQGGPPPRPDDPSRGFARGPGGPGGPGGRGGRGGGGVQLDPLVIASNPNTVLGAKLLAVPALRTKYLGYVRDLADKWLDWSRLGPIAQQYHDLIDADVKRDTRKLESYEDFATSLGDGPRSLKTFAEQRRTYLLNHPEIKKLAASN